MNSGDPTYNLDVVGRLLVNAAEIVQRQEDFPYDEKAGGGNMHPVRALYIAGGGRNVGLINAAVRRLFACCGTDFMDHDQVENIDDLVAAAFWEMEADRA